MTTENPSGKPEALPESMLEAAAIWHARLREPKEDSVATAQRAEFDRWMAADRRHSYAFEETKRLWDTLEAPVAQVMKQESALSVQARLGTGAFRPVTRGPAMLAACLIVLLMTGVIYRHEVMIRLDSDHMTAVGERTSLALADGSRVTLNTDTAIAVDLEADRRLVRLLRGEAWFDINSNGGRPFFVETRAGGMRVTGTSFGVRLQDDAAVVSLTKGQLELFTEPDHGGSSVVALGAGQQARLTHGAISEATALDNTTATAWLRGQLVFFDTPLADVVAELKRYRRGNIVIANDALDDLRISGVFRTDDPDAALEVIAETLPVRVIRLTKLLVLLR